MHSFYAGDRTAGRPKGLEAEHGTREPFYCSMVLLHDVIKIFGVADNNGCLMRLVVVRDRGCVGPTLINRALLRESLSANSRGQEGRGSGSLSVRRQEKIHSLAFFISTARYT